MKKEGIIYKAQNKKNGMVYIGATAKSLKQRKADHIQKAQNGTGSYFQEAIGTYGAEAFSWEQIDTASDANDMAFKEKHYILKYNTQLEGYNGDSGGGIRKKVYQYDLKDGSLLRDYNCLSDAADAVNAVSSSISNACLGYNKSCKGSIWSYSATFPISIARDKRLKKVRQYNLLGVLLAEFISVAEASKKTGISKTCISRCCRGERDLSGGFVWKYL